MRATSSVQNSNAWDMGSWNITMGFQRVKAYVSRDAKAPRRNGSVLKSRQPGHTIRPSHRLVRQVEDEDKSEARPLTTKATAGPASTKRTGAETYTLADDPTAPRLHFDLLLDSGATFPLLYEQDISALGIDLKTYPAQTATGIAGISQSFSTRLYELRAEISDANGASLVDPARAVWPGERRELGAVVPVAVVPPQGPHVRPPDSPVQLRADGARRRKRPLSRAPGLRLSGMLPFMACYASVVPGSSTLWLADVLGAHKFPGQRRLFCKDGDEWERGLREMAARSAKAPAVRFEHELEGGGMVVDEEKGGEASLVRAMDRDGEESSCYRVGPRKRRVRFGSLKYM